MVFEAYDLYPIFITCSKYLILAIGRFNVIPQDTFVFLTFNTAKGNVTWVGELTNYFTSNMFMSNIYASSVNVLENSTVLVESKNSTDPGHVVYKWVSSHLLLSNLMAMFGLFAIFTLGYLTMFFLCANRLKISFWNYFIRLCLLSYYTLTNLSILYMFSDSTNVAMYFICSALLFFNTLCLPIYTYVAVKQRYSQLTDITIRDRIGCIYLQYMPGCYYFTTFLLIKQALYSLVFVLGHVELVHRVVTISVQGIINTMYFIILLWYRPFLENRHHIQSIAVTCIKYLILLTTIFLYAYEQERQYSYMVILLNGLIFVINFVIFVIPYLPFMKKKIKEKIDQKKCWNRHRQMEAFHLYKYKDKSGLPAWVIAQYIQDNYYEDKEIEMI